MRAKAHMNTRGAAPDLVLVHLEPSLLGLGQLGRRLGNRTRRHTERRPLGLAAGVLHRAT